ncbi:MAG: hypothetical protein O7G85_14960 [Planctomycetota bacterium]|nr:hypothetical protein [Planctomycetota bacterium]
MPIAHVCQQCGEGMARVRTQREPHYGLRVVICPKCDWTCVRRKPPATVAWHTFLRRVWIGGMIFLKSIITAFMLLFMTGTIIAMNEGPPPGQRGVWLILLIMLVLQPLVIGTWLTTAFSHLPRWRVFATWTGLFVFIILCGGFILGLSGEIDDMSRAEWEASSFWRLVGLGLWEFLPISLAYLALMMVIMLGGIPLGQVVLQMKQITDRWHYRWLLKRRRLRRSLE